MDVYTLGNGHYERANEDFPQVYREVVADFEDARQHAPDDPKLLDYLGRAYVITGQRQEAMGVWRQAERLYRGWGDTDHLELADEIAKRREELAEELDRGDER